MVSQEAPILLSKRQQTTCSNSCKTGDCVPSEELDCLRREMAEGEERRRKARRFAAVEIMEWLSAPAKVTMIPHFVECISAVIEADLSRHQTELYEEGIDTLHMLLEEMWECSRVFAPPSLSLEYIALIDDAIAKVGEWGQKYATQTTYNTVNSTKSTTSRREGDE